MKYIKKYTYIFLQHLYKNLQTKKRKILVMKNDDIESKMKKMKKGNR